MLKWGASVQHMSDQLGTAGAFNGYPAAGHFQIRWVWRGLAATILSISLQFWILTPSALGAGLQSNAAVAAQPTLFSPAIGDSLHPALEQVGQGVGQIQIDRWKVSKSWKEQLQNDADSISSDLIHQIPGLSQQAQAAPAALDAQLRLMQNVDALYDVLVRLTMAADLTGQKSDARVLDSALEQLEAARKAATTQMVAVAAQQHQQLAELQARAETSLGSKNSSGHRKTIVVNNETGHGRAHRTIHHRKPSLSKNSKPQAKTSPLTGNKGNPQ